MTLFALALMLLGTGCPGQGVGRPCDIGTTAAGGTSGQFATLSSPALECPSHICLLPGAEKDPRSLAQMNEGVPGTGPLCTAICESNEDCEDGEKANEGNTADKRCRGGFACAWPTTVGAFACQRMCVCTDFVTPPMGGFKKPMNCP